MQARIPAAPVSPAYSLMSHDHVKLKYLFDLIKPAVVMVQDGPTFEKALKALDLTGVTVVHVLRPCDGIKSVSFAELAATPVTAAVAESIDKITPDTVGKLLFTSGSTGMPKAVINTQRMMCANAAMMMQVRPRDANGPQAVFLDWMPWNHTMGGNALFNPALIEGGTLYIDDGRPVPGLFEETLRNLHEISPTYYANVPAGYAVLASAMEKDDALCRSFFKSLAIMKSKGVEVKPIKQANGMQEFNEVYFTDVRIPDSQRLGNVGDGWNVSLTTLMNERMAAHWAFRQESPQRLGRALVHFVGG